MKSFLKISQLYVKNLQRFSNTSIKTSDISTDMLVTLSMGHGFDNCQSHQELCKNLKSHSILTSPIAYKVFEKLDRNLFINKSSAKDIYKNIPQLIGSGQNMTSPLMHAVALENMLPTLQKALNDENINKLHLLDIGTGSGYICFALYLMTQELIRENSKNIQQIRSKEVIITGIDLFDDLISRCRSLQNDLIKKNILLNNSHDNNFSKNVQIKFEKQDFEDIISEQNKNKFNIVHCGAASEMKFKMQFKNVLDNQVGVFIYPEIQEDGEQNLMMIEKNKGKISENILMKCMYSLLMDKQKLELNKYFVQNELDQKVEDDNDKQQQKQDNCNKGQAEQNVQQQEELDILQQIKQQQIVCKTSLELFKQKLKLWQENFKIQNLKKPTLVDMNKNQEAKRLLEDINEINRKLNKLNKLEQITIKKK